MKVCRSCNIEKPYKDFSKDRRMEDGFQSYCKLCNSLKMEKYNRSVIGKIKSIYRGQKRRSKLKGWGLPQYTQSELIERYKNDPKFLELYNNWVSSGYKKDLAPSFDRLDDYKGYSFDNIRVTTYAKNRAKSWKDRKEGINNKTNISIDRICLKTGKILQTYHSVKQASRVENLDQSNLVKCCKGKVNSVGGYNWEYSL